MVKKFVVFLLVLIADLLNKAAAVSFKLGQKINGRYND